MEIFCRLCYYTVFLLSYENFRCAIESRDELPNAEVLKIKIIEESEARKQASGSLVTAVVARNKEIQKGSKSKGKWIGNSNYHGFKCYKCGLMGHIAKFCRTKKSEDSDKESKQIANNVNESYSVTSNSVYNVSCVKTEVSNRAWILDSGCTAHMCGDRNMFISMNMTTMAKLNLASQESTNIEGKGIVHLQVSNNSGSRLIELKDTLHVPELRTNLVSVAKITNKGCDVIFDNNKAYIRDKEGDTLLIAERQGDLYYVRKNNECANITQHDCSELLKWHEKLGHLNCRDLLKLIREKEIPNINVKNVELLSECAVCIKGKMTAMQ